MTIEGGRRNISRLIVPVIVPVMFLCDGIMNSRHQLVSYQLLSVCQAGRSWLGRPQNSVLVYGVLPGTREPEGILHFGLRNSPTFISFHIVLTSSP